MRVLLDTHAFLWAAGGSERLSPTALAVLEGPEHELLFSAASAYEIGVKVSRGRLELPDAAEAFVATRVAVFELRELPVTTAHALAAAALPAHHRDPWDRLLVAQARAERVPILTADHWIRQYDVETLW
jgi:PIN domain nuclease of toxin-antitoxin system